MVLKIYSQNDEQQLIFNYFGNEFKGKLLDIGANDGKTLSNSYACIQRGWDAVMVEPSKKAFEMLRKNMSERDGDGIISMFRLAIADKNERAAKFYESGTHLNNGDTSLVSSLIKEEAEKWNCDFELQNVDVVTFDDFLTRLDNKHFDLITIDAEGMDYSILTQIDLNKIGCRMLIIEFNGKNKENFVSYCSKFDMTLYSENAENLIFVR